MLHKIGERLRRSPVVWGLLLVNVAVFVGQLVERGVVDALGLPGEPSELFARPWTLVTVFFLHEHAAHLVVMVLMLLVFGTALEAVAGARQLLFVYLAGGLVGSLTIVFASAFVGSGDLSVGSSAAMFAIAAAFAALRPDARLFGSKAKHWAAALLLFQVPFAFSWPLGSLAHLAGLGVGGTIGYRMRASTPVEYTVRTGELVRTM